MYPEDRIKKANRITFIGLLVNIFLAAFKFIAGMTGRSSALIADAFHSISDFATDIVVLLGFKIVQKPADQSHNYGHGKVETISSVIIGIILGFVALNIFWNGAEKVYHIFQGGYLLRPGWIAFYVAVSSVICKEILYRYTIKLGRDINSSAVIANAWHHRSDSLSSVGAILGVGGAIMLGERWRILDPIAAIIVSLFILKTAVKISKSGFNELIDASLAPEAENRILDIIRSVPGAENPHNIRTRKIGNYVAIDAHIHVDSGLNVSQAHDISTDVENKIKKEFGQDSFIYVHIEPSKI
ncbi:MAG: cation diffusion facilitator family transporter [Candidatus Omnitrophica bacterium]|nr:cation diffusion facilitator family transporter [Candidatus Omnitrophota bacterium]